MHGQQRQPVRQDVVHLPGDPRPFTAAGGFGRIGRRLLGLVKLAAQRRQQLDPGPQVHPPAGGGERRERTDRERPLRMRDGVERQRRDDAQRREDADGHGGSPLPARGDGEHTDQRNAPGDGRDDADRDRREREGHGSLASPEPDTREASDAEHEIQDAEQERAAVHAVEQVLLARQADGQGDDRQCGVDRRVASAPTSHDPKSRARNARVRNTVGIVDQSRCPLWRTSDQSRLNQGPLAAARQPADPTRSGHDNYHHHPSREHGVHRG